MKIIFLTLSLFCLSVVMFAQQGQLGTVTDLHMPRNPCPSGFVCGYYTVTTPYTPTIYGYAAVWEPQVQAVATDVFFAGAGGQGYWQGSPITTPLVQSFWDDLHNFGHRIVQWAWSNTWSIAIFNGLPVYNRLDSDRAATVVDFFQSRYDGDFNLIGSSWGSGEVAFLMADWITRRPIHYAAIISGPLEMNIAEGCETTDHNNPYWYNPGTAGGVDLFMGLMATRPCYNRNVSYDQLWHENSIEYGGVYAYPNTNVGIYLGGHDSPDITNRGGFYYNLLLQAGQPLEKLSIHLLPDCAHDWTGCVSGLTELKQGLLAP